MRAFAKNHNDLEQVTLERFVQATISHDTMSIGGLLERIHALVVGSDDFENLGNVGLLNLLANNFEVNTSRVLDSGKCNYNEVVC